MNAKEKLADYQRQFGVYAEANSEVIGAFGATVTAEQYLQFHFERPIVDNGSTIGLSFIIPR